MQENREAGPGRCSTDTKLSETSFSIGRLRFVFFLRLASGWILNLGLLMLRCHGRGLSRC